MASEKSVIIDMNSICIQQHAVYANTNVRDSKCILPGTWGLAICVSWWPGLIYAAVIIFSSTELVQYTTMNIYLEKMKGEKESESAQF